MQKNFNVLFEPISERESERVKVAQKCGKTDFVFHVKFAFSLCFFSFSLNLCQKIDTNSNQLHNSFNVIIIGFEYLYLNRIKLHHTCQKCWPFSKAKRDQAVIYGKAYAYGKSEIYWDTEENHAHNKSNIRTANKVNSCKLIWFYLPEGWRNILENLCMNENYANII